jgi:FtsZ-binding cell division protein ZapB
LRLEATEASIRRALGIQEQSEPLTGHHRQTPTPSGVHRGHRRFVRDGDVPVVVRNQGHEEGGTNRRDQAQQVLREQIAAREQVERRLQEALTTIEHLQTHMAHERIAREETLQQAEAARRQTEQALQTRDEQLATERQARLGAERERDDAIAARQEAEERLRVALAFQQAQEAPGAAPKARGTVKPRNGSVTTGSRNRQPEIDESEAGSEFVEWWKPGWRDRFK